MLKPEEWAVETYGKCARLHGHTYELEVTVKGEVKDDGMIINYFDLDKAVKPIVEYMDHKFLNTVFRTNQPTTEVMVRQIAAWLGVAFVDHKVPAELDIVTLKETPKTEAMWMA
jgi:6-pyruvoyltetrahydropterin/6-carboxytetrahydropterin synthase